MGVTGSLCRLGALIWLVAMMLVPAPVVLAEASGPNRAQYLEVAKQGWVFDFRSSLMRRDPDLPPVRFNGRDPSTGAVCVFGDPVHALSREVLVQFELLLGQVFNRTAPITLAGEQISDCPPAQRIYLRLYAGQGRTDALNADLRMLDDTFQFRLSRSRTEQIRSPAQGLGFFGRNGDVAHLMVRQPTSDQPTTLERDFYRSILIEELFQVFSFGVDILKFGTDTPFLSKLQENPARLKRLDWSSPVYMQRLLDSNPDGLCGFDVFMLHALAKMPMDSSNSEAFLGFINDQFDQLLIHTQASLATPELATLFDPTCLKTPEPAPQLKALKN